MSKVYFSDFNAKFGDDVLKKFDRLLTAAGIDDIDYNGKLVAIKIHFGEWGNMAFLRQQYAKVVADRIKAKGGKVFLTDANTLYPGYRGNAVDHIYDASWNGYTLSTVGCPIIIADGLRGTDDRGVPVEGARYAKVAYIGSAVADADVIISLTHCKGHINAGYGGILKNIGMGCGSKRGKANMHSNGQAVVDKNLCVGCGKCQQACANNGIKIEDGKAVIQPECLGCGYCFAYCPMHAINCQWNEAKPVLNMKIAEYTKAVIDGKPAFHIAIANDIQSGCDCNGARKMQLVPDVGMFAGFDPIAIDQACIDKINAQPIMPGSSIADHCCDEEKDVFKLAHPESDWEAGLKHGEALGLGTREYELVTVK